MTTILEVETENQAIRTLRAAGVEAPKIDSLPEFFRLVAEEIEPVIRRLTSASNQAAVSHDLARVYLRPLIEVRELARMNRGLLLGRQARGGSSGPGRATNVGDPCPKGPSGGGGQRRRG